VRGVTGLLPVWSIPIRRETGLLAGPDLDGVRTCRELYGGPVIASGGVGSIDDITACAAAGAAGVVVGKALYEGRVDLAEALQAAKEY